VSHSIFSSQRQASQHTNNIDRRSIPLTRLDAEHDRPTDLQNNSQPQQFTPPESSVGTQQPWEPWPRDSPNYDFYNDCFSFVPTIWAFFFQISTIFVLIVITNTAPITTAPFTCAPYIYFCVLLSLVFCKRRPVSRKARLFVRLLCFVCFSAIIGTASIFVLTSSFSQIGWYVGVYFLACLLPCLVAYLGLAILDEWRIRRAASAHQTSPEA
jgi:hypothetical protein